jgi:hypothetical protein
MLILVSCSRIQIPYWDKREPETFLQGWSMFDQNDYRNQLSSFGKTYIETMEDYRLQLSLKPREYIENLALSIIQNNELFFQDNFRPRIHIVKHAVPFHFSLPGRIIFLSTSLLNKYVKHEAILASIISFELIRSDKKLYNKNIIIPTGYLPTERMLSMVRIDVDEKIEIHKWAYYTIRRSGFEGEYYLSWLQTINRNTADFIQMIGDASSISREEAMFKAFLVKRAKVEDERVYSRRESSKDFYQFLFFVKDRSV